MLTAEEVDHNELEAKIAKMNSHLIMKQVNMAMQEADTLLFLLKVIAKEDDEVTHLLQVSSLHRVSGFKHKHMAESQIQ